MIRLPKKLLRLLPLCLLALSAFGCDSWSGVDITDSSQLKKLAQEIKKHLPPDALVAEVSLYYADQREPNIMGSAYVVYKTPPPAGAAEAAPQALRLLLDGRIRADKTSLKKDYDAPWQSFEKYDLERIPEVLALAGPHLEEWDFIHAGVRDFALCLDGDPPGPVYLFTVDGRPKSSPLTTVGRYSGIYYHEMYCFLASDGKFEVTVNPVLKKKRGGM